MSNFLHKKLSALVPYKPGEQPKGLKDLIKLNTNESPFPPSSLVKKALQTYNYDDLRLYPDPECDEFLNTLAKAYGVKRDMVTVGNGSDELLAFTFNAMCENGAAFADITYGFYPVYAALYGVSAKIIPLKQDFTIDVKDYESEKSTVFIANPNAPTGIALPLNEIEILLLQDKSRLVVIDEAYVDFGAQSAVSLVPKYKNLLVIGTFSKSRNLAGMRLGYAISNSEIIADLNTVKFSFNPYNINRLSLVAGKYALIDELYFKMCCNEIVKVRDNTYKELLALGFVMTKSSANFLFARPPEKISGIDYYNKLRENSIIVRHFNIDKIKNHVRITVGTAEEMQKLIDITKKIIKSI